MARPSLGEGKLVAAQVTINREIYDAIRREHHFRGGKGEGASFRRVLLEEGWALYCRLGNQRFYEQRLERLDKDDRLRTGAPHGRKSKTPAS